MFNMGKEKKGGKRMNKSQLSDAIVGFFHTRPDETFDYKQIFRALHLNTHPLKMLAIDILNEMVWDDFLVKMSANSYRLNMKGQVQEGVFRRKSNGKNSFLADGSDTPVFVSERNSLFASDGDRVKVQLMARRPRHMKEAMVTEIIAHARDTFVGKLHVEPDIAFLVTEGNLFVHDIIIPKKKLKGGKTGDKAVAKITQWPTEESKTIVGEIIDVLGRQGENTAEMHAILAQYGLPYKYPKEVEAEAGRIDAGITPQDLEKREDFRDVCTMTVDPKDAKDFDDALSVRYLGTDGKTSPKASKADAACVTPADSPDGLWEVGVHIADVSHYVAEDSVIDKEARKRATSVYLVDRTIPMLPERLSNFICSLRPDEEKLCFSMVFVFNAEAEIVDRRLVHTVIRSNRRFAYEEVQAVLEDNGVAEFLSDGAVRKPVAAHPAGELAAELVTLNHLAKKLRERRFKNGAVNFDREEMRFDIDEKGKPVRCYFKKSLDANKLIEEFMLIANKTVAEMTGRVRKGVKSKTLPYRIHDQPDPLKLENLRSFISPFGYKLKTTGSKGSISKSLNGLLSDIVGTNEQKLIETVALRSMMKARYSVHNIGHYGLAFDYYTHFTSPIRRYPDLLVHRLLTRYQAGGRSANADFYEELCEHSSDMEQTAANAERDSIKYKMVEFMGDKLGEEYDAHISGIQSYGIYCEIDENHCEGMVPLRDLDDDYYDFDEKNYCLVGRRRRRRYRLGDAVRIKVASANTEKRQLDFALVRDTMTAKRRR